ncbi:MAG: hypothetical protein KDJ86_03830 [Bauldia sp.]|uniref:hypothetical protein n=1 Tax=Bauldia sp. TaxID=2575872 RepID=UPI001D59F224|nr:hypothetical protein [Bauldia sp.]MCB1494893.1 hypothetical protein [Bauldia sp.]
MDHAKFKASIAGDEPPAELTGPQRALWHAGKGDWSTAHDIIQDDETSDAAWVHAHLHRMEGDMPNARYWYSKAGKPFTDVSLDEEFDTIANILIGRS